MQGGLACESALQRADADAEPRCRPCTIPSLDAQGRGDDLLDGRGQGLLQRNQKLPCGAFRIRRIGTQRVWQVDGPHGLCRPYQAQPLDDVAKLAHVSWPIIA